MATASVIEKSLSPSPPAAAAFMPAGANCPCKSCLSTVTNSGQQIATHTAAPVAKEGGGWIVDRRRFTSDLEHIAYSIVMLVMEGRTPIEPADHLTTSTSTDEQQGSKTKRVATIREGHHSKQLSEKLMQKILNLNSGNLGPMTTGQVAATRGGASTHSCSARSQQVR